MKRIEVILCLGVIAFGLALAAYSAGLRVQADNAYREVMLLVDWHDLQALGETAADANLANPAARDLSGRLLAALPGAQLCYGEETIGTLLASGILRPASILTGAPAFEVALPQFTDDVARGAARHGYWYERSAATNGKLVLQTPDLPAEDLSLLPVCFRSDVLELAAQHNLPLLLRPSGSEYLGSDGLVETLEFCGKQPLLLFQGPSVLGYPHSLAAVAEQLNFHKQSFGWVEFDEQDGGAQLAAKLAPYVVRVHSIPPEEMVDYDVDGAVARLVRAARERNIRCLYIRPFMRGAVVQAGAGEDFRARLFAVNLDYFQRLSGALSEAGFTPCAAGAKPYAPPGPPPLIDALRRFSAAWAAGAAAILLLLLWFPQWPRWSFWVLRIGNVLAAVAAIKMEMALTPMLLACALAFPLLGFWLAMWLYQRLVQNNTAWCPRRWLTALLCLLLASGISALGGLLIHGALWDTATMLKVGQFRGVTLALGLPVLLFAAYAWQAETLQDAFDRSCLRLADYWQRFSTLWHAPIRYGDVAFIGIALGALGIVLLRSGNESPLEVLSVETWFRGSLEQAFAVRPRTKELLGHPLLVVFLLSLPWRNRLSLLFGLAALLAQVSILNTFCHLHTPLVLTLQRVALGVGLGLVSGAVWGALVLAGNLVWERWRQRRVAAMG